MKLPRRNFLHLAAGAAALPALSRIAWAQAYPSRPVRIIVGFAPGGGADIMARLMGQWLSERLGQQFIIENRPGADSNMAAEAVVRGAPDGYTLFLLTLPNAVNARYKLNFNIIADMVPIAGIMRVPNIMAVNPSVPVKTVPEFIAHAKANAGKINMGSAGIGSSNHISGELFKMMAGVDLVHVPYRGGAPAMTDLISGQVQVMFVSVAQSIEYVRANKLRALAVSSATRLDTLPDIPTVGETVPGYVTVFWGGIAAPKATPPEIIETLNREINAAFADANMKARLGDLGGMALAGSPADFAKLIADDTEKWGKVIRALNIKAE
jgi:tripartite-type tricarboxylate transporter receptor subunit TctC